MRANVRFGVESGPNRLIAQMRKPAVFDRPGAAWQRAAMPDKPEAQRTWGGRFAAGPAELMTRINASIGFDKRLWREDIAASKAHAVMLRDQNILSEADAGAILEGLDAIAAEYEQGGVPEKPELEDIHMTVEHRLGELIGAAAGRLHTARSRNDQVATDFRLWVRGGCDEAVDAIRELQRGLVGRAEEHADTIMPGFTHLQVAQPVTLGHHLLAYYEMLRRDVSRFADARARMNESPLGAAALAGTGFPIDRHATAAALGFERPTANSLDSVSDRDFALDYLSAAAQCGLHLSRLAEELILWASAPFGFVKLSDEYSTGSPLTHPKRHPHAAELVLGHSGRIVGAVLGIAPLRPCRKSIHGSTNGFLTCSVSKRPWQAASVTAALRPNASANRSLRRRKR